MMLTVFENDAILNGQLIPVGPVWPEWLGHLPEGVRPSTDDDVTQGC